MRLKWRGIISGGLGLGLASGTSTDPTADLKSMMSAQKTIGAPAGNGSLSRAMRDGGGEGMRGLLSQIKKSTTGVELKFERSERPFVSE